MIIPTVIGTVTGTVPSTVNDDGGGTTVTYNIIDGLDNIIDGVDNIVSTE